MYRNISISFINPSYADTVTKAAQVLAGITKNQKGNLAYDIFLSDKNDVIIIEESWESKDDFIKHIDSDGPDAKALKDFESVIVPASVREPLFLSGKRLV